MSVFRMMTGWTKPQLCSAVLAVSLAGFATGAIAADTPAGSSAVKTFGYVFSSFNGMSYNGGPSDCPDGLTVSPLDLYVASVTPEERVRISHLTKEELKKQVFSKIPGYGDGVDFELDNGYAASHDACTAPQDYPDIPDGYKTYQGKIAFGMNLDGGDGSKPAANTCAHEKFVTPTGEKVDNQLFRVNGCRAGRGTNLTANMPPQKGPMTKRSAPGLGSTFLLEIKAKDLQNDDNVEVGIYSSMDPIPLDPTGLILRDASIHVLNNPLFMNVTHGKIVNGVLTTQPMDLRVLPHQQYTSMSELYWRAARLRLTLQTDGSWEGMVAGYEDVDTYYKHVPEVGGFNNEINSGYTCVGIYRAVHALADGYPDPKTGKCTAISSAYNIGAVPAFVIHPQDEENTPKVAQADQGSIGTSGTKVERWLKALGW